MLLAFSLPLLASSFLGQIDEIGLLRVDPLVTKAPVSLELYKQSISGFDAFQALTTADKKIGKSTGKKVVRFVVGFDYAGDGQDELLVATELATDPARRLAVKIYSPPKSQNGDLGKPLASLATGQLAMAGVDRIVALSAVDFDADGRDELAVVRGTGPVAQQRLEIFDFPTGMNQQLGAALVSDWTFGPTNSPCFAVTAGDVDLDGADEIMVLRREFGGSDSLSIVRLPLYPIGESELIAADFTIGAPDGAALDTAFAIQRNGPIGSQIAMLRRPSGGAARLDIHTLPTSLNGNLSPPIASKGPLDGDGIGNPVVSAFAAEHDQKLPWTDFEGPVNAYFHLAYPNTSGEIVSSWIGPVKGLVGTATPPNKLEFDSAASQWGPAVASIPNWSAGSLVGFDAWHILRLDITAPTGIAAPGQWLRFTMPSAIIEANGPTKNRLRYTNPGGPLAGVPMGNLEMFGDPPDEDPPQGPIAGPPVIPIAAVMEFYLEKP
jgi:hypothetical protein